MGYMVRCGRLTLCVLGELGAGRFVAHFQFLIRK
jgi:hypothetical protein